MKISIITPSYNSGKTIEKAINSVFTQDYNNYEHIIVDGGSTDGTLNTLKRFSHLKWISEPDRGQVHAMIKGFAMASGDIIGYLNADDYYLKSAFTAVVPHFKNAEKVVIGKVLVRSNKSDGIKEWICDPKTDFPSSLRHWEDNAFCVNPVGYFYHREIQERIPLSEETGAKHDLEFLMEVSLQFPIRKIDAILGVFNHNQDTQTGREQSMPSYWQPKNFPFVDRLAGNLSEAGQKRFHLDRDRGYQRRRQWAVKEAFAKGMAKELLKKEEVVLLPEDENECASSGCGFVEHDRIGTRGDWIVPVMTMGKTASKSICHSLKLLEKNALPVQVYHIHLMNPETISENLPEGLPNQSHAAVGLSLKHLFDKYNKYFIWKFIAGVREPISASLSGVFENWPDISEQDIVEKMNIVLDYKLNYFTKQYLESIWVDIFNYDFDHDKKYLIIKHENVNILLYRIEELSLIFPNAMEEFLGIPNLQLSRINIGEQKKYAKRYLAAKKELRFDEDWLLKIYDSSLTKHFYTPAEISQFIKKWRK
jgi:glycosyltransferase involved in cell wall biosynthesis